MAKPKSKRKPPMSVGREVAQKCIVMRPFPDSLKWFDVDLFIDGFQVLTEGQYNKKLATKMVADGRRLLAKCIDTTIARRNKRGSK